jgi:hypothetical protein
VNPDNGSNVVNSSFLLSYVFVPRGKGFESRYLVFRDVSLVLGETPVPLQVGMALTRWVEPERNIYVTSAGPLTSERADYHNDAIVAYALTRAPEGVASLKLAECSSDWPGHLDQLLAEDGTCGAVGYVQERTAGWLLAEQQPGTVPVHRCVNEAAQTHFASNAANCEGLGKPEFVLGYGLAP